MTNVNNLDRMKTFMLKTFDKIADPRPNKDPVFRDLIEIKHMLYQLTENK